MNIIVFGLGAGILSGSVMALLDLGMIRLFQSAQFSFAQIHIILLWYMLVGAVLGGLAGLGIALFSLKRGRRGRPGFVPLVFIAAVAAILVWVIALVNLRFLPSRVVASWILANGLMLVAAVAILFVSAKKIQRADSRFGRGAVVVYAILLAVVCLLSFAADREWLSGPGRSRPVWKPDSAFNVIVISLDAVRADHLGCYGYKRETSPSLDRLAAEGVLLQNAFSHSGHTVESVPSLWTSVYPSTHQMRKIGDSLSPNLMTLPEFFRAAGYRTAVFATIPYVSRASGYGRGVDDFFEPGSSFIKRLTLSRLLEKRLFKMLKLEGLSRVLRASFRISRTRNHLDSTDAGLVMKRMAAWIGRNRDNPFFIYAHLEGGHKPYQSPQSFRSLFVPPGQGRAILNPDVLTDSGRDYTPHSPEVVNMMAHYDAKIRYHDHQVSRLRDCLRAAGLEQKTVIVVTADHGEEFLDHQGYAHSYTLYDEMIHVPLIFHGPGVLPRGRVLAGLARHVDILPTLLDLCGIQDRFRLPYAVEGQSLLPAVQGRAGRNPVEFVFAEMTVEDTVLRSLRSLQDKAIAVSSPQGIQKMFFHVSRDPGESDNRIEEEPEAALAFFQKMEDISAQARKKAVVPKSAEVDEATRERLKALGYIR